MTLSIKHHNANAVEFRAGDRVWFFSYQTCVAFMDLERDKGLDGETLLSTFRIRRQSNYSVTTAKHMNYMGVSEWPKVDDATFERVAGGE